MDCQLFVYTCNFFQNGLEYRNLKALGTITLKNKKYFEMKLLHLIVSCLFTLNNFLIYYLLWKKYQICILRNLAHAWRLKIFKLVYLILKKYIDIYFVFRELWQNKGQPSHFWHHFAKTPNVIFRNMFPNWFALWFYSSQVKTRLFWTKPGTHWILSLKLWTLMIKWHM